MRIYVLTILITSLLFSCENRLSEKQAKSLKSLDKYKEITRTPTCFAKHRYDFKELVKAMEAKHYFLLELSKWPRSFKNHIDQKNYAGNETFIKLAKNTEWVGTEHYPKAPELKLTFENAVVTEVVLGNSKIVQFLFANNKDAKKALPKMKLISAYTICSGGLKNPNYYFIKDCVIYFVRIRSSSYPASGFRHFFEEKHGKVEILRW